MNSRIVFISVIFMAVGVALLSFKPEQKSPSDGESKDVTLVVSGQGKTIDEARQNALRSAIEQAFGTFISSNTTILNDSLVKDEIVSVSSGNIKKYETLSEVKISDIDYATTLKATVSVSRLTTFCEKKGVEIEFKGALFAMNIKQQKLNEENEINVINGMYPVCKNLLYKSFNYDLVAGDPVVSSRDQSKYIVRFDITTEVNTTMNDYESYFWNTLRGLSMTKSEVKNYRNLNKVVYYVLDNKDSLFIRSAKAFKLLSDILQLGKAARFQFIITSEADTIWGNIYDAFRVVTCDENAARKVTDPFKSPFGAGRYMGPQGNAAVYDKRYPHRTYFHDIFWLTKFPKTMEDRSNIGNTPIYHVYPISDFIITYFDYKTNKSLPRLSGKGPLSGGYEVTGNGYFRIKTDLGSATNEPNGSFTGGVSVSKVNNLKDVPIRTYVLFYEFTLAQVEKITKFKISVIQS